MKVPSLPKTPQACPELRTTFHTPRALSPSDASDAYGCPNVPASAWDGRTGLAEEALFYCAGGPLGPCPLGRSWPLQLPDSNHCKICTCQILNKETRFSACTIANIHTLYYLCFTTFYLFYFTTQIAVCLHSPKGLSISWNIPLCPQERKCTFTTPAITPKSRPCSWLTTSILVPWTLHTPESDNQPP